jgi:hypothetical protein
VARLLRRVAAVVAVLGIAVLVAALIERHPPEVTAEKLAPSVENGTGSLALTPTRCVQTAKSEWRCTVSDNASGGDATYRVHVRADGCWDATRVAENVTEGQHMPVKASRCLFG